MSGLAKVFFAFFILSFYNSRSNFVKVELRKLRCKLRLRSLSYHWLTGVLVKVCEMIYALICKKSVCLNHILLGLIKWSIPNTRYNLPNILSYHNDTKWKTSAMNVTCYTESRAWVTSLIYDRQTLVEVFEVTIRSFRSYFASPEFWLDLKPRRRGLTRNNKLSAANYYLQVN